MPVVRVTDGWMRKDADPGLYWDSRISGFGVRVSKKKRAFIFQKSGGRRCTIGHWRDGAGMSVQQARTTANRLIDEHHDPNLVASRITLEEALENKLRRLQLEGRSDKTIYDYNSIIRRHTEDWLQRPLKEIKKGEIGQRHEYVGENSGTYRANYLMRILRAIWNHAATTNDGLGEWPGKGLKFFPEYRRNEPIEDLAAWRSVIETMTNSYVKDETKRSDRDTLVRDWFLFVLYTGLRKNDALTIKWEHISPDGWLHVPSPKGGTKRAFDMPLPRQALELLARHPQREGCEWVFWTETVPGVYEHMKEVRTPISRALPSPHRLRDTWATNAAEAGCPFPIIKKLLNHAVSKQDVTLGYINPGKEAQKDWMQRVADHIEHKMLKP